MTKLPCCFAETLLARSAHRGNYDLIDQTSGMVDMTECALLYQLASEVPACQHIVEIGAFKGKSTVALGLGSQVGCNATVWSIDPHLPYSWEDEEQIPSSLVDYYHNLVRANVAVRTLSVTSRMAKALLEGFNVGLLWVDGDHAPQAVAYDAREYGKDVAHGGYMVLHDTRQPGGGPAGVVGTLDSRKWQKAMDICNMTIMRRK